MATSPSHDPSALALPRRRANIFAKPTVEADHPTAGDQGGRGVFDQAAACTATDWCLDDAADDRTRARRRPAAERRSTLRSAALLIACCGAIGALLTTLVAAPSDGGRTVEEHPTSAPGATPANHAAPSGSSSARTHAVRHAHTRLRDLPHRAMRHRPKPTRRRTVPQPIGPANPPRPTAHAPPLHSRVPAHAPAAPALPARVPAGAPPEFM
jgi:hypothetical protein